jgi:hypothetical protein
MTAARISAAGIATRLLSYFNSRWCISLNCAASASA